MATTEAEPLIRNVPVVDPSYLAGDLIQPGHRLFGLIWINPQRVSGAPCFYGTRVPVKTLFDCLAADQSVAEFLDDFEGVTRDQALAVLRLGYEDLVHDLPRA